IVLTLVGLVRGGERLLEAGQDHLERDALLPLELLERLDQLLIHRLPPHSTTVRAETMSSSASSITPPSVCIFTCPPSASRMVPASVLAPSTDAAVFTLARSPTLLAKSRSPRRGRSMPGELTSSEYGPGSNPARSSRRLTRSDASAIASRSRPPSRSTVTRSTLRPCSRVSPTATSSRPSASSTGRSRPSRSISLPPTEKERGRVPTFRSCPAPFVLS